MNYLVLILKEEFQGLLNLKLLENQQILCVRNINYQKYK